MRAREKLNIKIVLSLLLLKRVRKGIIIYTNILAKLAKFVNIINENV
jgi:hypothetical protein